MLRFLRGRSAVARLVGPAAASRRSFHSSLRWCNRASPVEDVAKLAAGDKLHGYTVVAVTPVSDYDLTAVQLTHDQTGAQHLHMARKDSNNVFSVGFRTTPMDSTGVAHILEHTTLCGSQRFPVRDPFFKMLTRSLSTFMNAFTANDWTLYPFSSQNSKDFYNLLSVYLDCVFFPRLRELDFRQEGWRLECENPEDPASSIVFKGVVFNEMKGVFANSESIFSQALQNKLYPSHTYSHVSGGSPLGILDLTWEALKDFHARHYHPSNARFYTYGDLPLPGHLEEISGQVLGRFERASPSLEVPLEPRWSQPREHHIVCAPDPMAADPEKQTTVSVSFLLARITDPYESLVLSILSHLLVDGPASPFYQSLLDANIGSDFSPMTGHDNSTQEASFSVGLQGVREADLDRVKDIIWSTFEKVASEGFPQERIRAILHQIELGLKHQSASFGLSLVMNVMSPWIHNANPVAMVEVNKNVERFKEDIKNPSFLQDKIRQYFLDNKHHMTLTMTPDPNYEVEQQKLESEKLSRFVSSLSEEERSMVYQRGKELQEDQNRQQNADCLPTLLISDVERHIEHTTLDHQYARGVPVQYTEQPTNGMTYFRAVSGTSILPEEIKIYLPLFCDIITRMGAGDLDHRQFAQQCDLYTGGLSMVPHVVPHHSNPEGLEQGVLLFSHCLDRHLPYMLSLWEDVFSSPNLQDEERLRTLLHMAASNMAVGVSNSGHGFAMTASASRLSAAAQLSETFGGMTQVEFLKQLAEQDDLKEVLHKLGVIAAEVLDCGSFRCAVNASSEGMDAVSQAMDGFIDTLPGSLADVSSYTEDVVFQPTGGSKVFYQMPFPVNYVGQSYKTVLYTHQDSPKLRVLARLLSGKFLHREIREKGGAYGSGARHGDGIFSFFSYRDPHSTATLDVFQESIAWAVRGGFSSQDVEEAKLAVFSQVDAPVSPGNRGSTVFLKGISDELRQKYREGLFEVSHEDLTDVARRYLLENAVKSSAIIGPENDHLSTQPDWTVKNFSI